MDYELAKELKEAGFPFIHCNVGEYGTCENRHCNETLRDPSYCDPTLEELIEACGDRFYYLERDIIDPKDGVSWIAHYYSMPSPTGGYYTDSTFGKTPREAVTRLWLAIHK